ncbi:hypothetical protein C1646_677355 [Rhizophagus diaphanus]|nr:hypothetical protein C1646_677355 [Rhizophagus diaphanus] [Rhizophagus sp. MUCL 43196]
MANVNQTPLQHIINNYLPGIADRLHQIRQHTEGGNPLTSNNFEIRHFTANEIDQIVEERVSAKQKKLVTEDDINRIVEERISTKQRKLVTNSRDAFLALEIIAERLGYSDDLPRDVDSLNKFIEQEIGKLGHETFYTRVLCIASLAKTVGTIYDLPITISQGKNELTITDEFLVVETERDKNGKEKLLIILGSLSNIKQDGDP